MHRCARQPRRVQTETGGAILKSCCRWLSRAIESLVSALAVTFFGALYLLFGAAFLFTFVWLPFSALVMQIRAGH
jgi:hypothetical protein